MDSLYDEAEEFSLYRKEDPFFELYEGQHNNMYKKPVSAPVQPKKVNLNNPDDEKRLKHIQIIQRKLGLKSKT